MCDLPLDKVVIQLYNGVAMNNYVTTNIRLPEEDYLRLKEEAARKRKSLSAVIREKIGTKKSSERYAKELLALKTDWFSDKDYTEIKAGLKARMKRYDW